MPFLSDYRKIQIPSCELFELGSPGDQIGEGKQGTIYSLNSHPELVIKHYRNAGDIDEDTLTRLIEWAGKLKGLKRSLIENTTAWPKALVREWGEVIGITMPKAPERFTYLQPDGKRALTNIATAIILDRRHVRVLMPAPNDLERLLLAYSLCRLLAIFERDGLLFVDLSPRNILWTLTPKPEVFLLDCDSIFLKDRLDSARAFRTLNWYDPWFKNPPSHEEVRGLFALIFARLVFARLYRNDKNPLILPQEHPFTKHFQDLVTAGYSANLSSRPSMAKWQKRIEEVFWQEKAVYNSGMVPLFSQGALKTQIRLFFKLICDIIVEVLCEPLGILFIFLIIILLAGIRTHQIPQPLIPAPSVALPPLAAKHLNEVSGLKGAIQWSYNSQYIAIGTGSKDKNGDIKIYKAHTGENIKSYQIPTGGVRSLLWSRDGKQIVVGLSEGIVEVLDVATGKQTRTYTVKKGEPVTQISWSLSGEYLATLSGHKVHIYNFKTGKINPIIKSSDVEYLAWSPDGKSLGMVVPVNSSVREVQIWDISTGQKRQTVGSEYTAGFIFAWSPDGKRIAYPWGFGIVQVWDVATGKVLITHGENHPESRGPVNSLDWSPDGRYIATDGIEIWDADTGNHVAALNSAQSVNKILWSPDGRYIMAAEDTGMYTEDDGVIEIWDVTNLAVARQHLP